MKTRLKSKNEDNQHPLVAKPGRLPLELTKAEIQQDLELLGLRQNGKPPGPSQVCCGSALPGYHLFLTLLSLV